MTTYLVPMLEFLNPERLWFLAVVLAIIVAYLILLSVQRSRSRRPERGNLQRLVPREKPWKRHIAVLLATVSLASLIMAWARPKGEVLVPRERATIVVVIDVSKSMVATDVSPDRIRAAKEGARSFVGQLPAKFNVALVSFAASAVLNVPPTVDHNSVQAAIDALEVRPSTAIGEGIYTALDSLSLVPPDPTKPNEPTPAAIVLLSDGETNIGRPSLDAAREAKKSNVPVYTIAYGTDGGYIEEGGRRVSVRVNKYELQQVANASGGVAWSAASNSELKQVYEKIASSIGYEKQDKEITSEFVWSAVLSALLASLGVISLAARWP